MIFLVLYTGVCKGFQENLPFTCNTDSNLTPYSLHSALKEFFDPRRTNDSRTDFCAVYRRESSEFDRDNAKKYDEDLNTSLIFVSDSVLIMSD